MRSARAASDWRVGLETKNLSRALEDAGTLTSPLVPWNTCGATMAASLGVAPQLFLPYAFFNLLCPLISLLLGFTGWTMARSKESDPDLEIPPASTG